MEAEARLAAIRAAWNTDGRYAVAAAMAAAAERYYGSLTED